MITPINELFIFQASSIQLVSAPLLIDISYDLKRKDPLFWGTCFFFGGAKVPPLVGEDLSELLGQLLPSEVDENQRVEMTGWKLS